MDKNTDLTLRVLARIQQYSQDGPITGAALAAEFGISWRKVADIVEDLRDNGHKVGSSMTAPMGYFIAHHPVELVSTLEHLESRAKKILGRRNRLANWGGAQPTIFEQQIEAREIAA